MEGNTPSLADIIASGSRQAAVDLKGSTSFMLAKSEQGLDIKKGDSLISPERSTFGMSSSPKDGSKSEGLLVGDSASLQSSEAYAVKLLATPELKGLLSDEATKDADKQRQLDRIKNVADLLGGCISVADASSDARTALSEDYRFFEGKVANLSLGLLKAIDEYHHSLMKIQADSERNYGQMSQDDKALRGLDRSNLHRLERFLCGIDQLPIELANQLTSFGRELSDSQSGLNRNPYWINSGMDTISYIMSGLEPITNPVVPNAA